MNRDLKGFLILVAAALLALLGAAHGPAPTSPELQALASFEPHVSDREETPTEQTVRLDLIESAVTSATDDHEERAWLIMTGWRESRWAGYVIRDESRCRDGHGGRCDGGRAWSPWQLHGTDRRGGVKRAARLAIENLRRSGNYCAARGYDYWIGGTSLYATGKTCSWPEAKARVRQAQSIAGGLRK